MGCPGTFETRRSELALLRGIGESDLDDSAVLQSFIDMSDPGKGLDALYLRYVCLGQFAAVIGDSLFLHGALHAEGVGFVPEHDDCSQNAVDWCADMDTWHVGQMHAFVDYPEYGKDGARSFDDLLDYVVPWAAGHKFNERSTVYSNGFCARGALKPTDTRVTSFVQRSDIARIFVGHAPQGDCPSVIRNSCGVTVFMCDTMYSNPDFKDWDTRGDAAAYVHINAVGTAVGGTQLDSSKYQYTLRSDGCDEVPICYVGQELQGEEVGAWVRGVCANGDLLCSKRRGRKFTVKTVDATFVRHHLAANALEPPHTILTDTDEADAQSFLEHELAVSGE